MHRLFVAIRPPRFIREQLLALMSGVSGVRWQTEDQLHVTLRFIGEVGGHLADDICSALASVNHPHFEVAIAGTGTFARRGQAGALWAGLGPQEPLKALHDKVDQACVRAGIEPERRAYHPHITLARLKHGSGSIEEFMKSSGGATSLPFEVDSFSLYESILTPDGAHYSVVERYPLR